MCLILIDRNICFLLFYLSYIPVKPICRTSRMGGFMLPGARMLDDPFLCYNENILQRILDFLFQLVCFCSN